LPYYPIFSAKYYYKRCRTPSEPGDAVHSKRQRTGEGCATPCWDADFRPARRGRRGCWERSCTLDRRRWWWSISSRAFFVVLATWTTTASQTGAGILTPRQNEVVPAERSLYIPCRGFRFNRGHDQLTLACKGKQVAQIASAGTTVDLQRFKGAVRIGIGGGGKANLPSIQLVVRNQVQQRRGRQGIANSRVRPRPSWR
jgi:hypothetical protein